MSTTTANPPPPWLVTIGRNAPPGPVPLRGSVKQVAWAEAIRKVKLATARVRAPHLVAALRVIDFSGGRPGGRPGRFGGHSERCSNDERFRNHGFKR
jgi:hypothetical protein